VRETEGNPRFDTAINKQFPGSSRSDEWIAAVRRTFHAQTG